MALHRRVGPYGCELELSLLMVRVMGGPLEK